MYHSFLEVFAVISPIHLVGSRLVKVVVVVWGHDAQTLFLLSIGALYQLKGNSADRRAVTHKSWAFQNVQIDRWLSAIILLASDLIINVEIPLILILAHHPWFLQQEVWDFATIWFSSSAELNLKIFPLVERKPQATMGTNTQTNILV